MLAFEIILVLLLLPALLRPLLPSLRLPRWTDFLPAAALLLAGIHYLLEPYVFRMVPAYLLIALVCAFNAARLFKPTTTDRRRRFWPILGAVLGLLWGMLALTISILLPMKSIYPSGPYAVGTVTYEWTDEARPEGYTDDPADHRRLAVQFWYPTAQKPGWKQTDVPGAALLPDQSPYPVVIFSHGATGIRTSNTTTYRELASHGYVVASIDHTYLNLFTRFSNGDLVMADPTYQASLSGAMNGDPNGEAEMKAAFLVRVEDMRFVIDQLQVLNHAGTPELPAGSLALDRLGLFGHSIGAATAAQVCRTDTRCKAAILIDGTLIGDIVGKTPDGQDTFTQEPFPVPMMLIYNGQLFNNPDYYNTGYASNRSAYEKAKFEAYSIVIEGAGHLALTDLGLMLARPVFGLMGEAQVSVGNIDPQECAQALADYHLAFFDHILKGQPAERLQVPSTPYSFVKLDASIP